MSALPARDQSPHLSPAAKLRAVPVEETASSSSVVQKVRLILESFRMDDNSLSLSEISRRSGVSKASVFRLIQELLGWGILERSGNQYHLGMRAFELGCRVPLMRDVRERIRPAMASLFSKTGQTIHLAARDGHDVVFLEKIEPESSATRASRVSGRVPLHCSATGKVLLAHAPRSVLFEVLQGGLEALTPRSITDTGTLMEQLSGVLANGYAVEQGEVMPGSYSVAVPVRDGRGTVIAALSITGPAASARISEYVRDLQRASVRISG
ncbi:IclR family transcriptional regulator [Herbiconiux sp. P15]|uniref:IclR family transcriptional regulator n=1 Tax=Herbiconiux liukaitaii TaxID=3342799 RepID=UPI0035B6FB98